MLTQPENALQAVKSLAFQRIPVAITATYKGLFFEERVAPLKVGPDYIVFRAPKSEICRTLRDKVILHSQVLPQSVRTSLQSLNPETCELTLSNFVYTGAYWRDRHEQRVEPEAPIKAEVTINKNHYRANLNNLSLHGAGLLVYFGDEPRGVLSLKMPLEISFQLGLQNDFHIPGTIASLRQMEYSLVQLGVQLRPSLSQITWLENYVARRKIEILEELNSHPVSVTSGFN